MEGAYPAAVLSIGTLQIADRRPTESR